MADRLYLSTADGGRAITDAVNETFHIVNAARALQSELPLAPKQGARFHFSLPGAVQGFRAKDSSLLMVENAAGRGLALRYRTDCAEPIRPRRHADLYSTGSVST